MEDTATAHSISQGASKGLKYLESKYDSKPWAFSCLKYSLDRRYFTPEYDYGHAGHLEYFFHYLALELLHNHFSPSVRSRLTQSLLPKTMGMINYFVEYKGFPDDIDTTTMAYSALLKVGAVTAAELANVAEKVCGNTTPEGIIQVIIDPVLDRRKNRVDACICIHVLIFGYMVGVEGKLRKTEEYVLDWLESGKWKSGTKFYKNPLAFLWFASRLAKVSEKFASGTRRLLLEGLENADAFCRYVMDFALVALAFQNLGLPGAAAKYCGKLVELQDSKGGWAADGFYGDNQNVYWGGKVQSSVLATAALCEQRNSSQCT